MAPGRLQLHPVDADLAAKLTAATDVVVTTAVAPPAGTDWLPVKTAQHVLRVPLQAWQLMDNPVNHYLGGPTPLASVLGGGLLGAGLGYLGGRAAEWFLPDTYFEHGTLRRRAAMLGGALGTLPGLAVGAAGMQLNREDGRPAGAAWLEPNRLFGPEKQSSEETEEGLGSVLADLAQTMGYGMAPPAVSPALRSAILYQTPFIPAQPLTRAIWQDPYTPIPIQAAATGLLQGARITSGEGGYVSPADIARLAAHMGAGAISASVVGRTLGALAGLTPEAQSQLQRAGIWAGALKAIIPQALGG